VSLYDAFANMSEGSVALMVEYMDGGSLQDIVEAVSWVLVGGWGVCLCVLVGGMRVMCVCMCVCVG
jgi:hypothetical protein